MPVSRNEYNARAMGGTELSIAELERNVDPELLASVDIIPGRWRGEVKTGDRPLIFWVHDTADDPEMNHLSNGGWRKFDLLVFVSHWQRQQFVTRFGIPWRHTRVLRNAVEVTGPPSPERTVGGPVRFIYHTTPHRGLEILAPSFVEAAAHLGFPIHLDVYSSFKIYGNPERDSHYRPLFDLMRGRPDLFTCHGTVSNAEVRAALRRSHAFVYPCIWPETGCRSLMEASVEGVLSATTDLAVLPETGGNTVFYFPFSEIREELHEETKRVIVEMACTLHEACRDEESLRSHVALVSVLASREAVNHSWRYRAMEWNNLLERITR